MANGNRGMGRGLAAILSPTIPPDGTDATPELRRLPVDLIAPNPRQPRQTFDQDALQRRSRSPCASAASSSRCSSAPARAAPTS